MLSTTQAGFRKRPHSPAQRRDYGTIRCQTLSQRHLCPYCGFYLSFQHHWPWLHALDNVWPRFPDWRHRCCQNSLWECHHPSQASFRGLHRSNTSSERYDPGRYPLSFPHFFSFSIWNPACDGCMQKDTATSTPAPLKKTSFRRIWPATSAAPPLQTTSSAPWVTWKTLKVQANKLTLYSNWAGLIISGSTTKVMDSLNASPSKDQNGLTPSKALEHQLNNNILVQNQATKYITPSSPFLYQGVTLTVDLYLEAPAQAHVWTKA